MILIMGQSLIFLVIMIHADRVAICRIEEPKSVSSANLADLSIFANSPINRLFD